MLNDYAKRLLSLHCHPIFLTIFGFITSLPNSLPQPSLTSSSSPEKRKKWASSTARVLLISKKINLKELSDNLHKNTYRLFKEKFTEKFTETLKFTLRMASFFVE